MIPVLVAGAAIYAASKALIKYRGENLFRTLEATQVGPSANNQNDIAGWLTSHIEDPKYAEALIRLVSKYFGDRISLLPDAEYVRGRLIEDTEGGQYYEIVVAEKRTTVQSILSFDFSDLAHVMRIPAFFDKDGRPTVRYEEGDLIYTYKVTDHTDSEEMTNLYLDKIYE